MKKIFALILMSLAVCVNANANNPNRYLIPTYHTLSGVNTGFCSYFDHGVGFVVGGECMGISFEGAIAGLGNYKGENQYGSGGLSNDYRVASYLIGYIGYIQCGDNMLLSISPKIGIFEKSRLYNDQYYGSDVAYSDAYFEGGLDIGINVNSFTFKVGATNRKINVQIGAFLWMDNWFKNSSNKKSTSSYYGKYEYDIDVEEEYTTNSNTPSDSEMLEYRYYSIENQISANKKQMREFSKSSIEYKVRKEENKTLKEQMNKIDEEYFELTGRYIYDGGEN